MQPTSSTWSRDRFRLRLRLLRSAVQEHYVVVTSDSHFPMLLALRRASNPSVIHLCHTGELAPGQHAALSAGTGTAISLGAQLPASRQAVAKHLVQLARAVAQLADVGAAWDGRLRRIKRIAETTQRQAEPPGHNEQGREK